MDMKPMDWSYVWSWDAVRGHLQAVNACKFVPDVGELFHEVCRALGRHDIRWYPHLAEVYADATVEAPVLDLDAIRRTAEIAMVEWYAGLRGSNAPNSASLGDLTRFVLQDGCATQEPNKAAAEQAAGNPSAARTREQADEIVRRLEAAFRKLDQAWRFWCIDGPGPIGIAEARADVGDAIRDWEELGTSFA